MFIASIFILFLYLSIINMFYSDNMKKYAILSWGYIKEGL